MPAGIARSRMLQIAAGEPSSTKSETNRLRFIVTQSDLKTNND
jgi:hypothetical protein